MQVDKLLKDSTHQLQKISTSCALDSEVLLLHALNTFPHGRSYNRAFLRIWPEHKLEIDQLTLFKLCLKERLKGKPIAYITGFKEFWSLNLHVTEDTLIPRADTEVLVEQALKLIPEKADWNILDLGAGSGAIALAIASERKNCHVFASDKSFNAISIAKRNAQRLAISNCFFLNANWLNSVTDNTFQIIISNPPYIKEHDPHLQQAELQYEPITALTSKNNGLKDIEQIIQNAITKLTNPAYVLLEHGYDQAQTVSNLFLNQNYQLYSQAKDINNIVRVSIAYYKT